MKRLGVVLAATALVGACYEYTGPAPAPNLFLTGTFSWALTNVPGGGAADTITLAAASGTVTGSGVEYDLGRFYSSFSISGQYADTSQAFALAILYANGDRSTYVGQVWGADSLSGIWSDLKYSPVQSRQRAFSREAVPPCANPAPVTVGLTGAPIAIVQLRAGVDALTEAELLADRYGFLVGGVNQAENSFNAVVTAATAAVLRCEPTVAAIAYPF